MADEISRNIVAVQILQSPYYQLFEADNILNAFSSMKVVVLLKISLKSVPNGPVNNIA